MNRVAATALQARLRGLTSARVGLGRSGASLLTRDRLDLERALAEARDAVHARFETSAVGRAIEEISGSEVLRLHSMAPDRGVYLRRPDLGRELDEASRAILDTQVHGWELVLIVADGLSALAVERHAVPTLERLLPGLEGWRVAPVCVVEQGRVAVGDRIGEALGAELSVVFIGERPGLSSPDSLGAYVTWQPGAGRTDSERNCISNIRAEGLSYREAARQLLFYLTEARRRRLTGVALKEASGRIERG